MITKTFDTPKPNLKIGDRVALNINGNLRVWIVEGYNADKTSFVFSSNFRSIVEINGINFR